jgi:hypothetical protein
MLSIDQIADRLKDLTFAEARTHDLSVPLILDALPQRVLFLPTAASVLLAKMHYGRLGE